MIVLDTNVVSELMRPSPSPAVVAWLRSEPAPELCTTSITLAELLHGIERLPHGRRRDTLAIAATDVFSAFADRVWGFDHAAAAHYASIVGARERSGAPISGFDAQIAAICRANGAALATRDVREFADTGVTVLDPWAG